VRRALDGTPDTRVQLFSAMSGQGVEEARGVLSDWLGLAPRA
jgi:hypothetical protein